MSEFYRTGRTDVTIHQSSHGVARPVELSLVDRHHGQARHRTAAFGEALADIALTRRVVRSGAYDFEIAEVNPHAEGSATLLVSTYRSSLSGNPGNAAELAFEDQGRRTVYVSSLGQGATSSLTRTERQRFVSTGSLLLDKRGNIDPLPACSALLSVLDVERIPVGTLRSDSSGRLFTSALGACLPAQSINSLYHNAPPQLSSLNAVLMVIELSREARRAATQLDTSPDPDRIDSRVRDLVRATIPEAFSDDPRPGTYPHAAMAWANARALTKPARSLQDSPAIRDVQAVLSRQTNARFTLVVGARDPLFQGVDRAELARTMRELSTATAAPVLNVVVPGAHHGAHAAFPHFYRTLEDTLTRAC